MANENNSKIPGVLDIDDIAQLVRAKIVADEKGAIPAATAQPMATDEVGEGIDDDIIDEDDLVEAEEMAYEEGLEDGILSYANDAELIRSVSEPIIIKRENTRSRLALIYTLMTFVVFIFAMIIAVIDGLNRDVSIIDNLSVVIPLISGVFLGTLGFVLGFYFRKEEEDDKSNREANNQ